MASRPSEAQAPIIEFVRVSFAYDAGRPVLSEVDLRLAPGGFYLITGPSGSGKSTLLRLVSRLEEPTEGRIAFNGRPLGDYDPPRLRRSLLNIQQAPVVLDETVRENLRLAFGLAANRDLAPPTDDELRAQLRAMELASVSLDDNARALSVGQQQRLCLVRGMLLDPEVMLVDEPTSALDDHSAEQVSAAIGALHRDRHLTVLMVSHRDHVPAGVTPVRLRVERGRVTGPAEATSTPASADAKDEGRENGEASAKNEARENGEASAKDEARENGEAGAKDVAGEKDGAGAKGGTS